MEKNGPGGYFEASKFHTGSGPDEATFARLSNGIDSYRGLDGSFHFQVIFSDSTTVEWKQTKSPLSAASASGLGFSAVSYTMGSVFSKDIFDSFRGIHLGDAGSLLSAQASDVDLGDIVFRLGTYDANVPIAVGAISSAELRVRKRASYDHSCVSCSACYDDEGNVILANVISTDASDCSIVYNNVATVPLADHSPVRFVEFTLGSKTGTHTVCAGRDSGCYEIQWHDGDCDNDNECAGHLQCGHNNCYQGLASRFDSTDDCCYDPSNETKYERPDQNPFDWSTDVNVFVMLNDSKISECGKVSAIPGSNAVVDCNVAVGDAIRFETNVNAKICNVVARGIASACPAYCVEESRQVRRRPPLTALHQMHSELNENPKGTVLQSIPSSLPQRLGAARYSGFFWAPETAQYTFLASFNDFGKILLSSDSNPSNAAEILRTPFQYTWKSDVEDTRSFRFTAQTKEIRRRHSIRDHRRRRFS